MNNGTAQGFTARLISCFMGKNLDSIGSQRRLVTCHQLSRDLKERVELIQPSHLLIFFIKNCMPISEHPTTLTKQCATLLTAKEVSTPKTMLGCVILGHRLMTMTNLL